ncbi:MAG: class I SAM-dependent methyltransferase [Petrotogales bacterium]
MKKNIINSKLHIQEKQYIYPYHYIPKFDDNGFSQVQYWSWGFRYLGGMKVVLDQLNKLSFDSLIDIGCGDGRFLKEVAKSVPTAKLLGIDSSLRAIKLAKAMNPSLNYKSINIIERRLKAHFDVATLVEVLEHIEPDKVETFLENIAMLLNDRGWLILTVPHKNKGLNEKHYQHFSSKTLYKILKPYFREIVFIPFDVISNRMVILTRLIGGQGKHFILTTPSVLTWFYRLYVKRFLYTDNEKKCMRIAAICQKALSIPPKSGQGNKFDFDLP